MKNLLFLFLIFLCSAAFGQNKPAEITNRQIIELPLSKRNFKPKLTLQNALKLMENFVGKQKINTSNYYFSSAKMIYYPTGKDKKEPVWFFEWMNERGAIGDYIHIFVSMDGKVWQMPTI